MNTANLNRKQKKATEEIERLIKGVFDALDLHLNYDTIIIQRGKSSPLGPWHVAIDNTNTGKGERVVSEFGDTLGDALSSIVGQAARAHFIASGGRQRNE